MHKTINMSCLYTSGQLWQLNEDARIFDAVWGDITLDMTRITRRLGAQRRNLNVGESIVPARNTMYIYIHIYIYLHTSGKGVDEREWKVRGRGKKTEGWIGLACKFHLWLLKSRTSRCPPFNHSNDGTHTRTIKSITLYFRVILFSNKRSGEFETTTRWNIYE